MQQSSLTSFNALSNTFAVATTTTGSTPVQVTKIRDTADSQEMRQYYVCNDSDGWLFFTLNNDATTVAAFPAAASNASGYILPPNSAGTFGGPPDAFFSGDLDTGTGTAFVCGGAGL